MMPYTEDAILKVLETVKDPEVPVLSVVELGIIRGVRFIGNDVEIIVTPTYSGCPAMHAIEQEIRAALLNFGIERVHLSTVFSPPWTTDWMSDAAKEKLRAYGIAPPHSGAAARAQEPLVPMPGKPRVVACPVCGSLNTETRSEFGSTACKALLFCNDCAQPFEHFKSF